MYGREADAGPQAGERVIAFCGHCAYFEVWALGGGGDCHQGHDCHARAREGHCPDKREAPRGSGPGFDMSE